MTKCSLCHAELESRGDCSDSNCDSNRYNIPLDILKAARTNSRAGRLAPHATGGGMDYIARFVTDNNAPYLLLKDNGDAGSPESIDSPAEVVLVLVEGGDQSISFLFNTTEDGMNWMAAFEGVDHSNYKGGRI